MSPRESTFSEVNVLTGVDAVVCVQLVFQAKLFGAVLALMRLPCFVPLQEMGLLHHIPSSIKTTFSTGLICAGKTPLMVNLHLGGKKGSVPLTANGPVQ